MNLKTVDTAGSNSMHAQPDTHPDPQVRPYLDIHEQGREALPGERVEWHANWRHGCLQRFADQGFPTLRDEEWRYTSVRPILSKRFAPAEDSGLMPDSSAYRIEGIAHTLVFVDGIMQGPAAPLGMDAGIRVDSISRVLENDPERIRPYLGKSAEERAHGFSLMNNALYRDGVLVEIGQGVRSDAPLELLFVSRTDAALILPRILIVARNNSVARIVERHVSETGTSSLTSGVGELYLEPGAHLDYHLVESQSDSAFQVSGNWAYLSRDSRLDFHTTTVGGALVRNDLVIDMQEPGAQCNLMGAYCLSGRQHVDNFTTVVHSAPHCSSNEHYKGVLDRRSRAVFHGRIRVAPDAQQTDAQQANNTLLLSPDAEIDTKPQLEIYANDVKCSHGATIGNLDEQAMFYLKSRGIDGDKARLMLIRAFVDEVLEAVGPDSVQQHVKALMDSKLSRLPISTKSG